jgi:hypothetical protein
MHHNYYKKKKKGHRKEKHMTSNLASVQKEHNENQMHWAYLVDHCLSEESIVAYESLLIILNPI